MTKEERTAKEAELKTLQDERDFLTANGRTPSAALKKGIRKLERELYLNDFSDKEKEFLGAVVKGVPAALWKSLPDGTYKLGDITKSTDEDGKPKISIATFRPVMPTKD